MRCVVFIIAFLMIAGCDVQKRHYRKGFYVHQQTKSERSTKVQPNRPLTAAAFEKSDFSSAFVALPLPPDSCDLLTFTDHTSVRVKIVDMNEQEVKYYFCDDQQQKIRTSRRNSITSIGYGGKAEPAITPTPTPTPTPTTTPPVVPKDTTPVKAPDTTITPAPVVVDTAKAAPVSACETIVFRDGNERKVNLLEITPTEIRYKNCGEELPLFRRNKSEIFMIVHLNGTKEVFKEEPQFAPYTPSTTAKKPEPYVRKSSGLAVTASVFGWLSIYPLIFVGSAAAIIMGLIYLKQAKENPRKYTSTKTARQAITVGIITASIWFLLLAISL